MRYPLRTQYLKTDRATLLLEGIQSVVLHDGIAAVSIYRKGGVCHFVSFGAKPEDYVEARKFYNSLKEALP